MYKKILVGSIVIIFIVSILFFVRESSGCSISDKGVSQIEVYFGEVNKENLYKTITNADEINEIMSGIHGAVPSYSGKCPYEYPILVIHYRDISVEVKAGGCSGFIYQDQAYDFRTKRIQELINKYLLEYQNKKYNR